MENKGPTTGYFPHNQDTVAAKLQLIGRKTKWTPNHVIAEKGWFCIRITEHQSFGKVARYLGVTDWRTKCFWGIPWKAEWQTFDDAVVEMVKLLGQANKRQEVEE